MFLSPHSSGKKYDFLVLVMIKAWWITNYILHISREEATLMATCFYVREGKDDNKVILEDKDLEVIGCPAIFYDDCTVIAQHIETGLWLSYKVKFTTIRFV